MVTLVGVPAVGQTLRMTRSSAAILGIATFVITMGLCVWLFAGLHIPAIYLVGPGVIAAIAGYLAYRAGVQERRGPGRANHT